MVTTTLTSWVTSWLDLLQYTVYILYIHIIYEWVYNFNIFYYFLYKIINDFIKLYKINILKNGYYIYLITCVLLYNYNIFIALFITLKLYSINYFYWYGTKLSIFENPNFNWIKQFIRLTDTGHIASCMVFINYKLLSLSHNVHFIIFIGYFACKLMFNLEDADRLIDDELNLSHMDISTYIHHSVPYMLSLYHMYITAASNNCEIMYNYSNIINTYIWLFMWFFCIYIPWRIITNDIVYSILDTRNKYNLCISICIISCLPLLANNVGFKICNYFENSIYYNYDE
jgi:hypothetical protein